MLSTTVLHCSQTPILNTHVSTSTCIWASFLVCFLGNASYSTFNLGSYFWNEEKFFLLYNTLLTLCLFQTADSSGRKPDLHRKSNDNRHVVDCGYGVPVCECRQTAEECEFDLEVDEIHSFTRYRLYENDEGGESIAIRRTQGVVFFINDTTGQPVPVREG